MGSDIDWDAIKTAQSGDTSGDKHPIKTIMESRQQFTHSDGGRRKESTGRKPYGDKK